MQTVVPTRLGVLMSLVSPPTLLLWVQLDRQIGIIAIAVKLPLLSDNLECTWNGLLLKFPILPPLLQRLRQLSLDQELV